MYCESKHEVASGLDNLSANHDRILNGKRIGLLANPASVDCSLKHASTILNRLYPGKLKALFSPQHGFYADKQDNMVESDHALDPVLKVPIFSLYSSTRIPSEEMFSEIDALVVDLQDVGTRVYTFIYTISYCIEVASRTGTEVYILDRPNPVGGNWVEGNILKPGFESFVGRFPIPMRHGLTVGEISTLFNSKYLGTDMCNLTVIPMLGWKRGLFFKNTSLPWIPPSPNMPTPDAAMVYPGQVIWEGTNISEGRGTTQPFEIFGAPFVDIKRVSASLVASSDDIKLEDGLIVMPGAVLRPVVFEPTSGKWVGHACFGFQIHVSSPELYNPYKTSIMLLQHIIKEHPDDFRWKEPPYEYEYDRLPIDLILGDDRLRKAIEKQESMEQIESSWRVECELFSEISRAFYIYD